MCEHVVGRKGIAWNKCDVDVLLYPCKKCKCVHYTCGNHTNTIPLSWYETYKDTSGDWIKIFKLFILS